MDSTVQKGFRLDLDKCTGCQACQVACEVENQLPAGTSWRWIDTYNDVRHPELPSFHLSLACNHCADPPCQEHCPALAYSKDPNTGVVTVDASLCIGCKYCLWACPYDAPQFDASAGVVQKCTYCEHRLHDGLGPACVSQCPTGALEAIDVLAETQQEPAAVRGFPRTDAGPSMRFVPLRGERSTPEAFAPPTSMSPGGARAPSKVTLRSEWPLLVFSLLTAVLVGWFAAAQVTGERTGPAHALAFLGLAAAAAGASTLHLGKKLRAYRAVLNWRGSWLSREILLFSAFVGTALMHLVFDPGPVTGWPATVLGFATVYAIDKVYAVTATRGLAHHSARALFTGALVLALALGTPLLIATALGLKLAMYTARKYARAKSAEETRLRWGAARVGAVLAAGALGYGTAPALGWAALVLIALGEVVDRCEFYLELEISTPKRQIESDLREDLAHGTS